MNSNILRAISDETRVAILLELSGFEQPACNLPLRLKRSQPLVSQHLKVLLGNGLVGVRKHGAKRLYSLTPLGKKVIDDVTSWI